MEGNEMSVAYENRVFNRKVGLSGGRMGCTLVTGFLGSGKTTLLNHILNHRQDLRLALLVTEFADSDVDSLLLNSTQLNAAFNLSPLTLTHGGGCCDVSGPFRESLQRVVDSKHNFDCLLIETSGLAEPDKFVAELEAVGIHLDMTVAVVDAESVHKILTMDIVRQQLQHVDLVLLNKCDLATLGQISDAEDILEELTGGAKIVRSQFCKVPLDLVMDFGKIESQTEAKQDISAPPILSHEALPKMAFQVANFGSNSVGISSYGEADNQSSVSSKKRIQLEMQSGSRIESFSSFTFESEVPLSLALFQSTILTSIRNMNGLLRAKGILWFDEDRESRFVFQWSGIKRVEAVSGGRWESPPKTCLVFIGCDKSELDSIHAHLSNLALHQKDMASFNVSKEFAKSFITKVSADGRFKDAYLKEELLVFGLKGSPSRGIKESQLNGALMRAINGKGNTFVTAVTSGQDYNLQLLLDEGCIPDDVWTEIQAAAIAVISKICKNFCPCRGRSIATWKGVCGTNHLSIQLAQECNMIGQILPLMSTSAP